VDLWGGNPQGLSVTPTQYRMNRVAVSSESLPSSAPYEIPLNTDVRTQSSIEDYTLNNGIPLRWIGRLWSDTTMIDLFFVLFAFAQFF
jgi:hypothetical protein